MASSTAIIRGYELGEKVGAGGFGAVYRARQALIGREVAIKVILPEYVNHPEFIRRFEAEAHLVARLEHIHIVPLYDFWREPGGAYIVMRWLPHNLRSALQKGVPPLGTLATWMDQIASGLTLAHRSGIIHRDLKPDNILLDDQENVYIADFGIAKDLGNVESEADSEAVIGSPAYLSPEQIRSAAITPATDIYGLGVLLYELLTGHLPYHNLRPSEILNKQLFEPLPSVQAARPDLTDAINQVIHRATAKEPAARYTDVATFAREFRGAIGGVRASQTITIKPAISADTTSPTVNVADIHPTSLITSIKHMGGISPYKGLRAFQEADAPDFFGRASLINRLLSRLAEPDEPILAVVGPSGSGKSSAVYAGLIPAIRAGALPGSKGWYIAEFAPGAAPLERLEVALLSVAINPPEDIRERLHTDPNALRDLVRAILPGGAESALVLVIDQFEEVFTLAHDDEQTRHFLALIHNAVTAPDVPLRIILTLRADYYDRPLLYPEFGDLLRRHTEVVLPLSTEELTEAITAPATRAGLIVEPELVAAILRDVSEQPGALPLLEFALTELYERREGRALTFAAYRKAGGVTGSLTRRADEIFTESSIEDQALARQIFLRLVTLGDGEEDTRRRVRRSELITLANDPAHLDAVIGLYSKYRLLTLDIDPFTREPTIEVAHESLIRHWERLQDWLSMNRETLRVQRQLSAATLDWLNAERDADYLAMGARLVQYKSLIGASISLNADEREYIQESIENEARQYAERELRRKKQIELGQKAVHFAREAKTAQARANNRLIYFLIALAGFVLLLGMALVLTFRAANRSDSLRLAAEALNILENNDDGELATLLALRSLKLSYTLQGDAALQQALAGNYLKAVYRYSSSSSIWDVAFDTQGLRFFAIDGTGSIQIFERAVTPANISVAGNTTIAYAISVSADGSRWFTGDINGMITVWDSATQDDIKTFGRHSGIIRSIDSFNTLALSGGEDGTARLWNIQTGNEIRQFAGHTGSVESVQFASDAKTVLTASMDGKVRLFDTETGRLIRDYADSVDRFRTAQFSPDGRLIAAGGYNEQIVIWDVQTGSLVRRLQGHADTIFSLAWSPDGRFIASGSADRIAIVWEAESGRVLRRYVGHTDTVSSVAFSPDGRSVLTGSLDTTARLWNVYEESAPDPFLHELLGHSDTVYHSDFSPDGNVIASASKDATARLWDARTGRELFTLRGHTQRLWGIAFSADGRSVVTASDDKTARVWDVQTGREVRRFDHAATVWAAAFSPDGARIVTGGGDKIGYIWDAATGQRLQQLVGHSDEIYGVAFAPDGKTVVTVSVDRTVRLWDAATGAQIRQFDGHTDQVYNVAFSHDGKRIATASRDTTARVWDAATGRELQKFSGHNDVVWTVAFSADDTKLLTAGQDRTVRVWDAATGEEIRRITGHTSTVTSAHFSPDGQVVVSSSYDRTIRLSNVDYQKTVRAACARLLRDVTPAERVLYAIPDKAATCS
jgi:WD40 repeat protein/serine/threonine protein kinase